MNNIERDLQKDILKKISFNLDKKVVCVYKTQSSCFWLIYYDVMLDIYSTHVIYESSFSFFNVIDNKYISKTKFIICQEYYDMITRSGIRYRYNGSEFTNMFIKINDNSRRCLMLEYDSNGLAHRISVFTDNEINKLEKDYTNLNIKIINEL